jgi:hypothetical protein
MSMFSLSFFLEISEGIERQRDAVIDGAVREAM